MTSPDLIVIGGGAAGLVTSAGAAGIGARVALIERGRLGGECLWTGCVPSKALIAAARAAHGARTIAQFGIDAGGVTVDFPRVMQRLRDAQARIAPNDSPERFRSLGVEVIEAEARFTGERTITAGGRTLTAKRIVIATGSQPAVPPIPGLSDVPVLTNESIFGLATLPRTLLVIGAGAIGLELAQAFVRLGSRVRVVEAGPVLLPREDPELVALLERQLAAEGVEIIRGASVDHASRTGGVTALRVTRADGTVATIEGDALLLAAGRTANVRALDLPRAGVAVGRDGIAVDATLRTTARGIWAAGDVTGGLRFTHVADYEARLIVRNAFFPFASKADYSIVPWATFTDPELAHVGLTEPEARDRHGDSVRVWRRPFAEVDRAIADGRTEGLVKLITDRKGRILGGHVLGAGASSLIGEIALAMKHGIGAGQLGNTMHAYPTYPEAIRQAAEGYYKSRFTGPVKAVARWFARR